MKLWSKRTLAGLLFDKKILNKVFPEDSLKKIYQHYKMERNISVIVIPYIKTKTIKVPDKKEAYGIANDIYNRSKIEDFEFLQRSFQRLRVTLMIDYLTGPNYFLELKLLIESFGNTMLVR